MEKPVTRAFSQQDTLGDYFSSVKRMAGVYGNANIIAASLLSKQQRVCHAGKIAVSAGFFGLVFQCKLQVGIRLGKFLNRLAQPLPFLLIVGGKQVIVAILARPDIHEFAVKLAGDMAHLFGVVEGFAANRRFLAGVAALPVGIVGEQVGNDRSAFQVQII